MVDLPSRIAVLKAHDKLSPLPGDFQSMSVRDLSIILIRLLAIYFGVQVIDRLADDLLGYYTYDRPVEVQLVTLSAINILVHILLPIALWVGASPLAERTLPVGKEGGAPSTPTVSELQIASITVLGLFMCALTLPQFISQCIVLFQTSSRVPQYYQSKITFNERVLAGTIGLGLQVIFGALLVVGGRFWVGVLRRVRSFGWDDEPTSSIRSK